MTQNIALFSDKVGNKTQKIVPNHQILPVSAKNHHWSPGTPNNQPIWTSNMILSHFMHRLWDLRKRKVLISILHCICKYSFLLVTAVQQYQYIWYSLWWKVPSLVFSLLRKSLPKLIACSDKYESSADETIENRQAALPSNVSQLFAVIRQVWSYCALNCETRLREINYPKIVARALMCIALSYFKFVVQGNKHILQFFLLIHNSRHTCT